MKDARALPAWVWRLCSETATAPLSQPKVMVPREAARESQQGTSTQTGRSIWRLMCLLTKQDTFGLEMGTGPFGWEKFSSFPGSRIGTKLVTLMATASLI